MRKIKFVAWLSCFAVCSVNVSAIGCPSPKSPINHVQSPQAAASAPFTCAVVPQPVLVLSGDPFYADSKASIVDPEKLKLAKQDEGAVNAYTNYINRMSNILAASRSEKSSVADCLGEWLDRWAESNALVESNTGQGNLYRIWALVPIAMAVAIIKEEPYKYSNPRVDKWLKRLANEGWEHVEQSHTVNNIKYWAAAGSAFTYVATGDCALFDKAVRALNDGIASIDDRGFIRTEIGRGRRALSYQSFALTPLALTAEVAFANGVNTFNSNSNALRRAAQRIIEADTDISAFEQEAGAVQDVKPPLPSGQFIWAEILNRHYHDKELQEILQKKRPLTYFRAGGNNSILFGGKN